MHKQEFRVYAWRPAGGMPRNHKAKKQDEEKCHLYVQGQGENEQEAAVAALEYGRDFLSHYGWDRFAILRTIADEGKLERLAEIKAAETLSEQDADAQN